MLGQKRTRARAPTIVEEDASSDDEDDDVFVDTEEPHDDSESDDGKDESEDDSSDDNAAWGTSGRRGKKRRRGSKVWSRRQPPVRRLPPPRKVALPERSTNRMSHATPVDQIRELLHVSYVPEEMPCREEEYTDIYSYLYSALGHNADGDCIYVAGVPGTGKTATVRQAVRTLKQQVEEESELLPFEYHEINCMKLSEPSQAYSLFWSALNPESPRVSSVHAQKLLTERFKNSTTSNHKPVVLLLDELDMLVTKTQSVVYNFFDWPRSKNSRLIVVAVANTMDLPERTFTQKVRSRVGTKNVVFNAYTHTDLIKIIESRTLNSPLFHSEAIQFCARKVSGVSGDARRALDICRRAVEVYQSKGCPEGGITRSLVMGVTQEMFATPSVVMLRHTSLHQKIVLGTLLRLTRREGVGYVAFGAFRREYEIVCNHNNTNPATTSELHNICAHLYECRYILMEEGKTTHQDQKLRLNISEADLEMVAKGKGAHAELLRGIIGLH